MAEIDSLKPASNMTDLEKYTLHAVRQVLRGMNSPHAYFNIMITQREPKILEITAWVPENKTLPSQYKNGTPIVPVHFTHRAKPMSDFFDVDFWPIVRELNKEMTKALQLGERYGRN